MLSENLMEKKMPNYEFVCEKCKTQFESLCRWEEIDKVKCVACKSKKIKKLFSCPSINFANPKESDKWNSMSYRGGVLGEEAKTLRRNAEAHSKVGANPYQHIDDRAKGEGIHDNEDLKGLT